MRQLKYAAFDAIDFEPVTHPDGDCYAPHRRALLRDPAIRRSGPPGPSPRCRTARSPVKVKGRPEGEITSPRGAAARRAVLLHQGATAPSTLDRVRIRTPTFANIPPLAAMLPGIELADVPIVVLSIDPCISCTER